jgi:hypothetical protein
VNPHAYNMRTDYYVVSPNSRAYTRGWVGDYIIWCAPAGLIHRIIIQFQNSLTTQNSDARSMLQSILEGPIDH